MNRVTRGSVVLAAALVVLSCEGDPTSDLRSGADHLVATPSTLLIGTGGTTTVLIEALDKQGNRLESGFSVGTVDAGLAVEEDTTYNKVYNNKGELLPPSKWTRAQYIVTATAAAGDLSFTVDAGGKSISVPVRVVPATIATLSTATVAAITDTVTATAPTGYRFTPATTVLFGTATSHVVGISTDSLTIRFVAPAGLAAGTASFSNLSLPYTEPTRYVATGGPLTTPAAPALPFTITGAFALDTITLTAPAGWRFTPGFAATGSLISVDSLTGQVARGAGKISTAADSASARFIVGKNRDGRMRATNMQIRGASGAGRYTLRSAVGQTLVSTPTYPAATVNKTSAAPGDTIIVTVPNGMRFQPNAAPGTGTVAIGASADSTTFRYIISSGVNRSSITRATLPGSATDTSTVTYPAVISSTVNLTVASGTTPNAGDTVTVTAPAGWRFSPNSAATVPGAGVQTVGTAADSLSHRFVIGPGASGVVTVTNMRIPGAISSATVFSLTSAATVTSSAAPNVTISPSGARSVGDTITVTAPAGWRFRPLSGTNASVPSVPGAAGLVNLGGSATDSLTLKFVIGPNASGVVSVTNMVLATSTAGPRVTLSSAASVSTGALTSFPATFSTTTPAKNDTITLTAGAGFKLLPTATVTIGGASTVIIQRAADSSSLKFLAYPLGGTNAPSVTGIIQSAFPGIPLTLPANTSVTLALVTGTGGTDLPSTAPTIVIPATGASITYMDAGSFTSSDECDHTGVDCRFYKFSLTRWRTFTVTLRWSNRTDIGGYFTDSGGNDLFGDFACDNFGNQTGGPEQCTQTILAAGDYWLSLSNFGTAPPGVSITIDGE